MPTSSAVELAAGAQIKPAHPPVPRPDQRDPAGLPEGPAGGALGHGEEAARPADYQGPRRTRAGCRGHGLGNSVFIVVIRREVAIVGTEPEQDLPVQALGG